MPPPFPPCGFTGAEGGFTGAEGGFRVCPPASGALKRQSKKLAGTKGQIRKFSGGENSNSPVTERLNRGLTDNPFTRALFRPP
eukprot:560418-Prorocentrum_minimum.AAC.1